MSQHDGEHDECNERIAALETAIQAGRFQMDALRRCQCGDDDVCAFVRERDVAREALRIADERRDYLAAEVYRLRAENDRLKAHEARACDFCHCRAASAVVVDGLSFDLCADAAACTAYRREWEARS